MTTTTPTQPLEQGANLHGFHLEKIESIAELRTTAYLFSHSGSGAHLLHLYNEDPNNLFSIAFKTPVHDSTGVPHILEHSVLCGSKKFPVKDPFQEMLKGSLQTFLNALTYPDKTVYPVSSQVEKDFFNLVDIYCDAVLNPLLTENTFYQEGWHFDVENPALPVGIKGIVYNEMKGVFSNFSSHVDRKTIAALFPDTPYFFESGGDPEHITDLTYQQFRDFHSRYYHPSNAFIVMYGNIPSATSLAFLNNNFLSGFSRQQFDITVKPQQRWSTPRSCSFEAPAPQEEQGTATVAVAWILGDTIDPVKTLMGKIVSHYLLGTDSSPLKRALIDARLGEDLADISGFDAELVQSVFAAGLRKTKPEHATAIESLIIKTLTEQCNDAIDFDLLEGALRQIEFGLREVTGGHFPFNLRLAERCYRSWMYGGDPLAHLAFEQPLAAIKKSLADDTTYFANFIKTNLLENSHRLCATIVASPEMGKRLEEQTQKQAKKLTRSFGEKEKATYHLLTKTLLEQQATPPSPEALLTLPKLSKSDLPTQGFAVPTTIEKIESTQIHLHPLYTSNIVYLDLGFSADTVPESLIRYLPLYCEYITRCGTKTESYEAVAKRIALASGGLNASVTCRTKIGSSTNHFFQLFMHTKALVPRFSDTLAIIGDLLSNPDFSAEKQLRDIILEERNGLNASIINAGHHFAIVHASAQLLSSRSIDEQLGGITQLRFLESLARQNNLTSVMATLAQVHQYIVSRTNMIAVITADEPQHALSKLKPFLTALPNTAHAPVPPAEPVSRAGETTTGIEISSAVNFIGKVWKMPPVTAQTAGQLYLIARILSTGYLWDKVRVEGGAYGGMASMSVSHPLFACASYRDPNCPETVAHFTKGLRVVAAGLAQEIIDQNLIGTIGRIDAPQPPHARGLSESIDLLIGNTPTFKQALRSAVLNAQSHELATLAQQILANQTNATTILASATTLDRTAQSGLTCKREPLLPA